MIKFLPQALRLTEGTGGQCIIAWCSTESQDEAPVWQSAAGCAKVPVAHKVEADFKVGTKEWLQLPHIADRDVFRIFCVFCGQWISEHSGSLLNHLAEMHDDVYAPRLDAMALSRTSSMSLPRCEVCFAKVAPSTKHNQA